MTEVVIRGLAFFPDGSVSMEYVLPEHDVKATGLIVNHSIYIPGDTDYDDEIEALVTAAEYLLRDVLDDLPRLPAPDPDAPAEESEEDPTEDEDEDED